MGQAGTLSLAPWLSCGHLLPSSPQVEAPYGLHQLLILSLIEFYAAVSQGSTKC